MLTEENATPYIRKRACAETSDHLGDDAHPGRIITYTADENRTRRGAEREEGRALGWIKDTYASAAPEPPEQVMAMTEWPAQR